MTNFLFIDCRTNKRVVVAAADQDQALRAVGRQLNHFCVMFIRTI